MLSGKLLPAHPKPLPNEVLSSWFARVAEANAVKQHSLASMRMEATKPPWTWPLDLRGGERFLQKLCKATGTAKDIGKKTTLTEYSGVVFSKLQKGARVPWILPTRAPSSNFLTEEIQFCPICLSEGAYPYFRRQWRLAFFTFCPIHKIMLYEACPSCGAPIAYHRHDCSIEIEKAGAITICYNCGIDFRSSPQMAPDEHFSDVFEYYREILMEFQTNRLTRFDLAFFTVLHQLCMVMASSRNKGKLQEFVYSCSGLPPKVISDRHQSPFSWRNLKTRYHFITMALWLLLEPATNIKRAWEAGAVRYASLVRDMSNTPGWYKTLTLNLNRQHIKIIGSEKTNFKDTVGKEN